MFIDPVASAALDSLMAAGFTQVEAVERGLILINAEGHASRAEAKKFEAERSNGRQPASQTDTKPWITCGVCAGEHRVGDCEDGPVGEQSRAALKEATGAMPDFPEAGTAATKIELPEATGTTGRESRAIERAARKTRKPDEEPDPDTEAAARVDRHMRQVARRGRKEALRETVSEALPARVDPNTFVGDWDAESPQDVGELTCPHPNGDLAGKRGSASARCTACGARPWAK